MTTLKISHARTFTQEHFLEQAKLAWGERFDYSNTTIFNSVVPVTINCRKHGTFQQCPTSHVNGSLGCKQCASEIRKANFHQGFIERSKAVWGDHWDYTNIHVDSKKHNVTLSCPEHGQFTTSIKKHLLLGVGCPVCYSKFETDNFINEAKKIWGDRWNYDKTRFTKVADHVIITCPIHGDFKQIARSHLEHHCGCKSCRPKAGKYKSKLTTATFIEKANEVHKDKYKYENCIYIDATSKVIVTCRKHGDFVIAPRKHLNGTGCRFCALKAFTA